MALELHTWRIEGVSPLLQSNPASMGGDNGGALSGAKKVYKDDEEAAIRCYKNDEGQFVHPTAAFRSGILVAASGRKLNKKSARAILAGAVFPAEIETVLIDAKGKPLTKYAQHKCRAIVGKAGILRVRPMYSPWFTKLVLQIDREFIPDLDVITEILNIAGRIVGIGEFRPDTSKGKSGVGMFGRFKAEFVN